MAHRKGPKPVKYGEEVSLETSSPEYGPTSPLVTEDKDVLSGNWTWVADEDGQLHFSAQGEP